MPPGRSRVQIDHDRSAKPYPSPNPKTRGRLGLDVQRLPGNQILPRHRHASPYAAIALAGSYLEYGDLGRIDVLEGSIIVHDSHEAHLNVVSPRGAAIVNLALPHGSQAGVFMSSHVDEILRAIAASEMPSAQRLLQMSLEPLQSNPADWPDLLVQSIRHNPMLGLTAWATERNLHPTMVSREFARLFGVSPKRFRAEAKARAAIIQLTTTSEQLAAIAVQTGFADQSHMHKTIVALTGRSPGAIRRG